ncbi:MAG: hypothetical protein WC365_01590 [Candidatus Babeliales bacterium]
MEKTRVLQFVVWFATVLLSKCVKLSLALGSYAVGLSGITVTLPLMGSMMSLTSAGIVAGAIGTVCALFTGLPLTFGLPSLAATLSWACSSSSQRSHRIMNFILHCLLPLICMTIFMTHPIGSQAWYYALYWLIPVAIWLSSLEHVFMRALQSTFVAHALGGTMWLITGSLTASQWSALVPVVAFERFMIAGLSTCVWYGIRFAAQKLSRPVIRAEQRAA